MRRTIAFFLLGALLLPLLCLAASKTLTNLTGETVSGVVLTFSESVRILSYDKAAFPDQSPSGRADRFTFSGGALADGVSFRVSWSPSSASIADLQWLQEAHGDSGLRLEYLVQVLDPSTHQVHVRLRVDGLASRQELVLYVDSTSVTEYVIANCLSPEVCPRESYRAHITNFAARDQRGASQGVIETQLEKTETTYVDVRRILLSGTTEAIEVDYDAAVLYPWSSGSAVMMAAYLGADYGLLNESYLFFRPDPNGTWPGGHAATVDSVRLRFELPTGWTAVSVWAGSSVDFTVTDPVLFCERYLSSPGGRSVAGPGPFLGVGPYRVLSKMIGGTEVVAAVIDVPAVPVERVSDLVFASFGRIGELLGPYAGKRFVFYTVSDYSANASGQWAMRHITRAIRGKYSAAWNYRSDNEQWLLYPDEIMWEWCEELSFGAFDRASEAHWFTDGAIVNTYCKIPLAAGYTELSDYYGHYVRCLESNEEDSSHLASLVGLALDEMIQQSTDGQSTIQDVFRVLYEQVGAQSYTNAEVQRALEAVTGERFDSFFQQVVYPRRVPVLTILEPYLNYPDLAVFADDAVLHDSASGSSLQLLLHNYGRQACTAEVVVFAGFPWAGGEPFERIAVAVPASSTLDVGCDLGGWPDGESTVHVQVQGVMPGDADTSALQKATLSIGTTQQSSGSFYESSCQQFGPELSGGHWPAWSGIAPAATSEATPGLRGEVDLVAVRVVTAPSYLFIHLRLMDSPEVGGTFRYLIDIQASGSPQTTYRFLTDRGTLMEIRGEVDGVERQVPFRLCSDSLEIALPRAFLPPLAGLQIIVQTRIGFERMADVVEVNYSE
jgi:hypothetical protein